MSRALLSGLSCLSRPRYVPMARSISTPRPRPATFRFYSEDWKSLPRDQDQAHVVIVGAGPSGLSAAIRLKQLAEKEGKDIRVVVVEKGADVGNHILSGAVLEPRALNELIPDWKERGAPLDTPARRDETYFLLKNMAVPLPVITLQQNHGNYIISLGELCRWMAAQAEAMGVEIYSGFPASEVLYHEDGSIKGIATADQGIAKNGEPGPNFTRGLELHAPITLFAEGARGSCSELVMKKFNLRQGCDPQTYGIGLKEVWEVPKEKHQRGLIIHTLGWPMDPHTWGGSFMYHWGENLVSIGYVVGLDYQNPYLNPYKEFQRLKHHPVWQKHLEGGKPISYGARALNEGGIQSIPELVVPGGALVGCSAGFLNVPKIKGTHTAMKSGMIAAEAAYEQIKEVNLEEPVKAALISDYSTNIKKSWVWEELHAVRNIRPVFARKYGLFTGSLYMGAHWLLTGGKEPFTLHHHKPDHECLQPASSSTPIDYPKPDGKLSFDLLTNLARSGTNHNEDQPAHLRLKEGSIPVEVNLKKFAGPEGRYCPAGVYEFVKDADGKDRLQINAQNCLHCKTCDIKDPQQNIVWTTPEGGGGPAYPNM